MASVVPHSSNYSRTHKKVFKLPGEYTQFQPLSSYAPKDTVRHFSNNPWYNENFEDTSRDWKIEWKLFIYLTRDDGGQMINDTDWRAFQVRIQFLLQNITFI